ncbi:hypothetical protein [Terriglobus sp. TAA 43]|uniref:hypothetical protein n=1 Tax=Terriglobus sp. TAA 43 TaxID=278961 RepID=UPI0018DE3166|nr:hypothetical protein [Terriglobus sp. TAA 43]
MYAIDILPSELWRSTYFLSVLLCGLNACSFQESYEVCVGGFSDDLFADVRAEGDSWS